MRLSITQASLVLHSAFTIFAIKNPFKFNKQHTMKENETPDIHLGNNIKHLMKAFQLTQAQLALEIDIPNSHLCNLLQQPDIEDDMLQKIADGIGRGVTVDMIKNYNHDDTISYIINNYTQNVQEGGSGTLIPNQNNTQKIEEGGTGTLIPKQDHSTNTNSTFQEGSTQNNYVAEQAFVLAKENTRLEKLLLYYRIKVEPDIVEKEIESLKNDGIPEEN